MSFSEYNGSKTKVSQTVGRIFKSAQDSFPKVQTSHGFASILKTISTSGSTRGSELERLSKASSPSTLTPSKFGLQKFRLRTGSGKKRNSNHHAELLDNQEVGDQEDSGDELEYPHRPHHHHDSLIDIPPTATASPPITQKQKRWMF